MSFLPHGRPRALSWYGSFAASLTAHMGLVSFVVFSGVVVLTPRPPEPDEAPEITVSLEILDANLIEQMEPVDDTNLVPEDAEVTEPDDLDAETPDALEAETPDELAALSPDDQDLLAPEDETLLAPDPDAALEPELETAEPEVLEPEVLEPTPLEPELAEPEVIAPEPIAPELAEPEVLEPEPVEPDLAEVLPDPVDEPLLVPQEVTEPEIQDPLPQEVPEVAEALPEPPPLPLPEPESPLSIDDLSPIDDTVLNPLASGGSGVQPVQDDVLALVAPEPQLPEVPLVTPEVVEEIAPVALPQDDATVIEEQPPEVVADPEPTPEVIEEAPDLPVEPEVVEEAPDLPTEPEVVEEAPDLPTEDAVAAAPAAPVRQPFANPTASDVAIGQLLRRIRATPQEQCTLALPRRVSGDALAGLALIGAREDQLDALAGDIVAGLEFSPVQTRELLDPRQCATLDALRQSESYPANRIGLSLDTATLSSGDLLTGRIVGAGGLYVTLLLVDDNGVVQDLAQFVRLDGTTPVFEAPVARSGPSRATRQVLLAIGTRGTPLDLSDTIGREAQEVFGPIPSETLQSMVFGVATFDVQ